VHNEDNNKQIVVVVVGRTGTHRASSSNTSCVVCVVYYYYLAKVFSDDEAHMSGSEIDDGTEKGDSVVEKETRYNYSEIEGSSRKTKGKQRTSQGTSDV
jgi:hypothetical protein